MSALQALNAFQRVAVGEWPATSPAFLGNADPGVRAEALANGQVDSERLTALLERLAACGTAAEASAVVERMAAEIGDEVRAALELGRDPGREAGALAICLRDVAVAMWRVEQVPAMKFAEVGTTA